MPNKTKHSPKTTEGRTKLITGSTEYNSSVYTILNRTNNAYRNTSLITLYEEMMLDDKVSCPFQAVNDSLLSIPHTIQSKYEAINQFVMDNLERINLGDLLEDILTARKYGFALFEPIYKLSGGQWIWDKLILIPHSLVDFIYDTEYGDLEKIRVGGFEHDPSEYMLFVYPKRSIGNCSGDSELNTIIGKYLDKKGLVRYQNIGLENAAAPVIRAVYDKSALQTGSTAYNEMLSMLSGIKDNSRIAIGGTREPATGKLSADVEVDFLTPPSGDGLKELGAEIEKKDKDFARAFGVPDDLGLSESNSGSYARAQTQFDKFWEKIVRIGENVEGFVNEMLGQLISYNFENPKEKIFSFDFETDDGLNEKKAKIVQTLRAAGVVIPDEFLTQYLGFKATVDKPAGVQAQPKATPEGFSHNTGNELTISGYDVANYTRIVNRLDSIEQEYGAEIEDAILKGVNKWLGNISSLGVDKLTVQGFDGNQKGRIRAAFEMLTLESYLSGNTEAASELEKKLKSEYTRRIETFEADFDEEYNLSYNAREFLRRWKKTTGGKLSKLDKDYIRKIKDYTFVATQDMVEPIAKEFRTALQTQVETQDPKLISASILENLRKDGLIQWLDKTPEQVQTVVRTASMQYFNNARINSFIEPELAGYVVGVQYSAIMDGRTTFFCAEHHGEIMKIDDPRLATIVPPNHFNCRSTLIPITIYDTNVKYDWGKKPMLTTDAQEAYGTPAKGFGGSGGVNLSASKLKAEEKLRAGEQENKNAFPLDNSEKSDNINNMKETDLEVIEKVDWAEKNIAVSVMYPDFPDNRLRHIETINQTVFKMNEEYGMGKLKGIEPFSIVDNAAYNSETDILKIGNKIVSKINMNIDDFVLKGYTFEDINCIHTVYSFDNVLEGILRHEMAHRIYRMHWYKFDELLKSSKNWKEEFGITERAKNNIDDCIAENIAVFETGKYLLNKRIAVIIEGIKKK